MASFGSAISRRFKEVRRLFWKDVDPVIRTAVLILLGVGTLLMILGFIGDAIGFWKDASFSPNVFSSLASACFGVPLALVVLRYLIDQQEELSAQRAARQLAAATVERMSILSSSLIQNQQIFEEGAALIRECAGWKSRMEHIVWPSDWKMRRLAFPGTEASKYKYLLTDYLNEWKPRSLRAFEVFKQSLPPHPNRLPMYQELELTWRYLDEAVRPKLLECGLSWLDTETAVLGRTVRWDPFPVPESPNGMDQSDFMHMNLSIPMDLPIDTLRDWTFALVDALTAEYYGILQIQDVVRRASEQLGKEDEL